MRSRETGKAPLKSVALSKRDAAQFVDVLDVSFRAGDGGDGIVAWLHEARREFGGPAGGDGGRGGSVYVVGDRNETTLLSLSHMKTHAAENGAHGGPKTMHGAAGKDVAVKVPVGTSVFDAKTGKLLADITADGQVHLLCRGGKGGRGNASFLSGRNRAPKAYERGDAGESLDVRLELKVLADVGIVGQPNAGKSTLLSRVSAATPKIAAYKFTTLSPVLGTVALSGGRSLVLADIPGLIEGAAEGVGLGIDFLRHIERCQALVHLVSMSPDDNPDPYASFKAVEAELKAYGHGLADKPVLVAASKIDVEGAAEALTAFKKKVKEPVLSVSAMTNFNLPSLLEAVWTMRAKTLEEKQKPIGGRKEEVERVYVYEPPEEPGKQPVAVTKQRGDLWSANSPRLAYWSRKIPLTNNDNILRFADIVKSEGVREAALKAGAKPTDRIAVGEQEYELEELRPR